MTSNQSAFVDISYAPHDPSEANLSSSATSPAINIQLTDRFHPAPWDQYTTDLGFAPVEGQPSSNPAASPYTPSYNSVNSWGSSLSWGGRENNPPVKNYDDDALLFDTISPQREEYDPNNFDTLMVDTMEMEGPASTSPFPNDPSHMRTVLQGQSPSLTGISAPSPGSEIDLSPHGVSRSRASSASSMHGAPQMVGPQGTLGADASPYGTRFTISTQPPSPSISKPPSPPSLMIPAKLPPTQGLTAVNAGLAPGVHINIAPPTPVVGADSAASSPGDHQSPAGDANAQNRPMTGAPPLPHANTDTLISRHLWTQPPSTASQAFEHPSFGPHRSPSLSHSNTSLGGSPMMPIHSPLRPNIMLADEATLTRRDRPASWQMGDSSLGLGFNNLGLGGLSPSQQGTVDPQAVTPAHPYNNPLLHPQTAAAGSFSSGMQDDFLSPGPVNIRRARSESGGHRRIKSEEIGASNNWGYPHPQHGGVGVGDLLAPPALGAGALGHQRVPGQEQQHRRRASHGQDGRHDLQHARNSSLSSHGGSVRSSPYPSPHASPARPAHHLPDPTGLSVFDTYGASGAEPGHGGRVGNEPNVQMNANTTNPPRVLVTTRATTEASNARRKNDANFTCPVPGCGSTFTRSFNLKGHMRSHNEERPYKCKWPGCQKGFARQHDCKRHEQLHLNIRPYTCQGCNKNFARMDALNRHQSGHECAQLQAAPGGDDGSGANDGSGYGPNGRGGNPNMQLNSLIM